VVLIPIQNDMPVGDAAASMGSGIFRLPVPDDEYIQLTSEDCPLLPVRVQCPDGSGKISSVRPLQGD